MSWFSWFFIKIRYVNRNPVRNTVMVTTKWPREWWILLWFCSFPLEFSKDRNDQKSHAKTQYRSGSMISIFSYTLQVALNKKSGSNSQFWFLHISDNFFLRSGSLTAGGSGETLVYTWLWIWSWCSESLKAWLILCFLENIFAEL